MIKHSQKQTGSTLIIVVIILAVAIVAGLGFVFWNKYASKPAETAQTTVPTEGQEQAEAVETTQTYQNSTYAFRYPKDGWVASEVQNGTGDDVETSTTVRTANWAQQGPVLGAGADVSIYSTAARQTLAEMKSGAITNSGGGKDVVDTQVAGLPAFSYNSTYEGVHYFTVFIKDNLVYTIVYRYAEDGQPDTYIAGYNEVVSSLSFK